MIPDFAAEVIEKLRTAGYEAFAVGGCVRDKLLGRTPSDWDVATSAPVYEIPHIFEETIPTGVRFGTYTVISKDDKVEVTTFRRDGKYCDFRRPESVSFTDDIVEDLARRDFTVNAMAMELDGGIIDPFGGMEDLRSGIIRCVGDPEKRFSEDALRMLRALRFSAVLGFSIDAATLSSMEVNAYRCEMLSAERVRDELEKMLLSQRPEFCGRAISIGLLSRYIMPGSVDMTGLSILPKESEARWCAFAFLVCSAELSREGPEELLRELRLPAVISRNAGKAAEAAEGLKMDRQSQRTSLAEYGERITMLAAYCREAREKTDIADDIKCELLLGGIVPVSGLAVNGTDITTLGYSGKQIGDVLRQLSIDATLGKVENKRESLLKYLKK